MQAEAQTANAHSDPGYRVGQDNVRIFGLDIHNPVFFVSGVTIVAFVIGTLLFKEPAEAFFKAARAFFETKLDFVFAIGGNIFVLFCLGLAASPLGKIRLGGVDAKPDYSYPGWFAMLFAAGMGIGLMFFGVLEPVFHTLNPPLGMAALDAAALADADPAAAQAARELGMAATIFHWGLHPWAIYAVVALALAFFCYNRGLPLTIRSAFYPILGKKVWGPAGHVIDTLAVFATLFGLATSLGFGAEQANAGLNYLFDIPVSDTTKAVLILLITAAALVSVLAGMDKGVKRLSEGNMILALALLVFVVVAGPTLDIILGFFGNIGHYLANVVPLSNWVGREDTGFFHGWTIFYWAWWISWSPFVGMFIARVSKGRTVREFIICVLLIPTLVCVLWMTAFGGTAVSQFVNDGYDGVVKTMTNKVWTPELSLFRMLEELPLASVSSFVGIILVVVFFVTSSDSGSLVIDTITAGGKMDAPVIQRAFWCVFEGLVAIVLLAAGGLAALQAAAIATGFPFALVLLAMCWSTFQGLRAEKAGG